MRELVRYSSFLSDGNAMSFLFMEGAESQDENIHGFLISNSISHLSLKLLREQVA